MQFWRPGDPTRPSKQPSPNPRRTSDERADETKKLHFLYNVENHQVVLVQARSGFGRAITLPHWLSNAAWSRPGKCIAVALPKQVSVFQCAMQFARQNGLDESHLGADQVGFVVSEQTKRSLSTRVVYFDCETLIGSIITDPLLSSVSVIILHDMQDRFVMTDLLVALLRQIQKVRTELRIILCGTFFDIDEAQRFFSGTTVASMSIPDGHHPVSIMHTKEPVPDYMNAALQVVKDCFTQWDQEGRPSGSHVLVFVPGADDANRLCQDIMDSFTNELLPVLRFRKNSLHRASRDSSALLRTAPLHGALDPTEHADAVRNDERTTHMKVIAATNVAESGVAVEGVATVLDCGYERLQVYDPHKKMGSLATVPISRASARHRATRAGYREGGRCFRLYTKSFFDVEMSSNRSPEILRSELSKLVQSLSSLGVQDFHEYKFMTPPPAEAIKDAVDRLHNLDIFVMQNALSNEKNGPIVLMRLGPQLLKSIMVGEDLAVGRGIAGIAAMLEVKHFVFNTASSWNKSRSRFAVAEGDLLTLLNVWRRYNASGQSENWCKEQGVNPRAMKKARRYFVYIAKTVLQRQTNEDRFEAGRRAIGLTTAECVQRAIAAGFAENACMVQPDGCYVMALTGRRVWLHASSVLHGRMPKWVVFTDMLWAEEKVRVRDVTVVDANWLVEGAPRLYERLT